MVRDFSFSGLVIHMFVSLEEGLDTGFHCYLLIVVPWSLSIRNYSLTLQHFILRYGLVPTEILLPFPFLSI